MVWRLRRYRGAFWVRPTDHMPFGWHWGWESRDRRYILHYEPLAPKRLPSAAWHKIWYRGKLMRGDMRHDPDKSAGVG